MPPEDNVTPTPLAGDGGQPPAGDTPAPAATSDAPAVTETISLDEAKKLRQEANSLRKRLKDLEDAAKTANDAKLDETARAKKTADDATAKATQAEAALKTERAMRAVERAAVKLNLDPELAAELVRPDMLEYDDAGQPNNVETVLKALVKKWPHLVKAAAPIPPGINADDGRGTPPKDPKAREAEIRQRYRV